MPALNRVALIGYLGRDPETRFTPTGKKVCQFTLAVHRPRRAAEGDEKDKDSADWFSVNAWGKLADVCQQYLGKGQLVYVEGRLQNDRWVDDKGETQYRTRVVARHLQMLNRRADEPEVAAEAEEEDEPQV